MIGLAILVLLLQIVVACDFFKKARKLDGIVGTLPKAMVLTGVLACATTIADWATYFYLPDGEVPLPLIVFFTLGELIPSIIFFAFIVRFYSVQTQLKTENESTLVIMEKMRRAKLIE